MLNLRKSIAQGLSSLLLGINGKSEQTESLLESLDQIKTFLEKTCSKNSYADTEYYRTCLVLISDLASRLGSSAKEIVKSDLTNRLLSIVEKSDDPESKNILSYVKKVLEITSN